MPITITGPAGSDGIHAETDGGNVGSNGNATATVSNVTINNNSPVSGAPGVDSLGINVVAGAVGVRGSGSAMLTISGNNTITTTDGGGTLSQARGNGNATTVITGNLVINNNSTNSDTQDGIETTVRAGTAFLDMSGVDSATINVGAGNGIFIDSLTQAAVGGGTIGGGNVVGIINSNVTVNLTNTDAVANAGIRVATTLGGTIDLTTGATVNTFGTLAPGIYATSENGVINVDNSGAITTFGTNSDGIEAVTTGGNLENLSNSGMILAEGAGSNGIHATTASGIVNIGNSGTVISEQATGVLATATTAGTLNLTNEAAGNISGVTGVGIEGTFTSANLDNAGSIGASTDLAVDSTTLAGQLAIDNSGTLTGYVQLGAATNTLTNSGTWTLRNFADTDGDFVRDALGVAVADLGTSGNNSVTNTGIIELVGAAGAPVATLNSAGQYLPLGYAFNSMAIDGPVQGQILGVSRFENAGVIDLTANPVAGDVLVISGGQTPGVDGGGVFVANGGTLQLDTVLNEGGAASQSDMLVVDSTQLGAAPTSIAVTNFNGNGALTIDNGIALVEVLNKAASADNVFVLGGRAAAGAYEYTLYHNGVGADAADGNWYLRSTIPVEPPQPPPGPEEVPNYRVEVPLDSVLPALVHDLGRSMLGTYRDRVGVDPVEPQEPTEPVFCKDPTQNFLCVPTAEQEAVYADALSARPSIVWGRIFGKVGRIDFGSSDPVEAVDRFVQSGPSYDFAIGGLQIGADLLRETNSDGSRNVAGLYAGIGNATADVTAVLGGRAGNASVTGYTVGGYWTHTGDTGWYLDAVLQGTFNQLSTHSSLGQALRDTSGWSAAGSLEAGYPFKLGGGWTLEPQAQIITQAASIDVSSDDFGVISFDNSVTIDGRLGLRLAKDWETEDDRVLTTWAHADLWHAFEKSATTTFSSLTRANPVPVSTDLGGTWGAFGVGASGEIKEGVTLFGSADYDRRLDGEEGEGFGGRFGLRVRW